MARTSITLPMLWWGAGNSQESRPLNPAFLWEFQATTFRPTVEILAQITLAPSVFPIRESKSGSIQARSPTLPTEPSVILLVTSPTCVDLDIKTSILLSIKTGNYQKPCACSSGQNCLTPSIMLSSTPLTLATADVIPTHRQAATVSSVKSLPPSQAERFNSRASFIGNIS